MDRKGPRNRIRPVGRSQGRQGHLPVTRPGVFFGGDAAFGPKNIIWSVEHGHQAAISIHKFCEETPVEERLPRGLNLSSRKMGMHKWAYKNEYNGVERRLVPHVGLVDRFKKIDIEVELGFTAEEAALRGAALPELRHADRLCGEAVHRMRCLHRHLSGRLSHHHGQRHGGGSSRRGSRPRPPTGRRRCTCRRR